MPRRFPLLAALLLLSPLPAAAQTGGGLAFLRIGTNASALAMGDAATATSRDAWATYWNPAGLAAADANSVALAHHLWFGDVRTVAGAGRFRAGQQGAVGVFATATGLSDLEARDGPGPADGFFDAQFIAAGVSYGRRFGPLHVGATAKYLSEQLYTDDANGYAFDAGAQLGLLGGGLRVGASLQNVGEMSALRDVATPLPRTVRAGAAVYPFRIVAADDDGLLLSTFVTAEVSHVFPSDSEIESVAVEPETRLHLGVAAEVLELVHVRGGYLHGDDLRRFSIGGGLGYDTVRIDYAFLPFRDGFTGHVLSLSYAW